MGRRPAGEIGVLGLALVATALLAPASSAQSIGPPTSVEVGAPTPSPAASEAAGPGARSAELESRPLGPARPTDAGAPTEPPAPSVGGSAGRTAGALAVVIVTIFLARWAIRALARGAGGFAAQLGPGGRAPSGVLSVLARYPVARGQSLVLLQMNGRVLLLSQSATGFAPLAEITDPEEVASLITRTRDEEGASLSARFTSLLARLEREPHANDDLIVGRTPTTVEQAMRLFPETRAPRRGRHKRRRSAEPSGAAPGGHRTGAEALAAIRRRLAELEGAAS